MAKALVYVTFKNGVLDPQGEAVRGSLEVLGFPGIRRVRVGKYIELELDTDTSEDLRGEVEKMCRQLLANPVIEDYRIEIPVDTAPQATGET